MMELRTEAIEAQVNDSIEGSSPGRQYAQQQYDEAIHRGHPEGWNNRGAGHGYWQPGTEPEEATTTYQNWERTDAAAPSQGSYDTTHQEQDQHSNPPWYPGNNRYEPNYQYPFPPSVEQAYSQGWYGYPQAGNPNWSASSPYYPQYPHHHPAVPTYDTTHSHATGDDQQHTFTSGMDPYAAAAGALPPSYTSPGHPHSMSHVGHPLGSEHHQSSLESLDIDKRQRRNRTKSFPEKLMQVLSETVLEDAVAWLPDGRSFVILNQDLFVSEVLNKGFKATKYASFIRKLHRWGFVRLTSGIGADCFHHPLFTKETPGNAAYITCPTVQGKSAAGTAKKMNTKPSMPGVERFIRTKMSALAAQQQRIESATASTATTSSSHRDHQIYPSSSAPPKIKEEESGEPVDGGSGHHGRHQEGRFDAGAHHP